MSHHSLFPSQVCAWYTTAPAHSDPTAPDAPEGSRLQNGSAALLSLASIPHSEGSARASFTRMHQEMRRKREKGKFKENSTTRRIGVAYSPPQHHLAMEDGDEEDRRARRREEVARQELEQIDPEKEQQETYQPGFGKEEEGRSTECPYLDTVNRHALDFDFEKRCSVSLSTHNVYCCLVCGQYFQGRGKGTHAHTHSLEALHHVFMNLRTGQVYCLPEGYEVVDPSLEDIRHVLHPKFTKSQVEQLDRSKRWSRGLDGTEYLPGTIGLNNLKATDYVNAVLQGVMRVTPVRNFFLVESNYASVPSPLVQRFGELVRKVWNSRNFKGQVSPHEFMQAVSTASSKRFQPDRQSDPVEFLSWLLHALHSDLTGGKPNKKHSVISRAFQGRLEVVPLPDESANQDQAAENGQTTSHFMPFWMLGLDLPPPPLFQDSMEKNIIPQVPLYDILKKFDGEQVYEQVRAGRKKFRIAKLPPYLILHYKRFTKVRSLHEANPFLFSFCDMYIYALLVHGSLKPLLSTLCVSLCVDAEQFLRGEEPDNRNFPGSQPGAQGVHTRPQGQAGQGGAVQVRSSGQHLSRRQALRRQLPRPCVRQRRWKLVRRFAHSSIIRF